MNDRVAGVPGAAAGLTRRLSRVVAGALFIVAVLASEGSAPGFPPAPKPKPEKPKRPQGWIELNKGWARLNDQLIPEDPIDPSMKTHSKVYTLKMVSGRRYQIDHRSKAFDAYLRLSSPEGKEVARDDDSGGALNARIIYNCTKDGEYKIHATALGRGLGLYELEIREE